MSTPPEQPPTCMLAGSFPEFSNFCAREHLPSANDAFEAGRQSLSPDNEPVDPIAPCPKLGRCLLTGLIDVPIITEDTKKVIIGEVLSDNEESS